MNQENINAIAEILKVSSEDLVKMLGEGAPAVQINLTTFTEEELKKFKSNTYQEGKKAGIEMDVDSVKKEEGVETSSKTVKGLVEAIKKKVLEDAKIEPNQKLTEMEQKVKTLQQTITEQTAQLSEKDKAVQEVQIKGELYQHINLDANGPALGKDDVITLMKNSGFEFKLEEGKTVVYKDGEKQQDKMANALSAGDVIKGFMSEKKLITVTPDVKGRGGNNQVPPAGPSTLSELKARFKAEGKSELGEEFMKAVQEATKSNPDFNLAA
jgi:hypothetical protein